MAKQAHTLIAQHLGMDSREVWEYRYHYGHTSRPIYAIGSDYYATGKHRPRDIDGLQWTQDGEQDGTPVWIATASD